MPDRGEREVRGYRVIGRVQGVGFRWWTRTVAEELGLDGSVRNEADGSVRVLASGPAAKLDALAGELGAGPRFARVDRVEEEAVDDDDLPAGFSIET